MRIFGEAVVAKFARKYPHSRNVLRRFLSVAAEAVWPHLSALKQTFPAADYTSTGVTIFDVGGNKYRVIAIVNYEKQAILIQDVLTHAEYDRENF